MVSPPWGAGLMLGPYLIAARPLLSLLRIKSVVVVSSPLPPYLKLPENAQLIFYYRASSQWEGSDGLSF